MQEFGSELVPASLYCEKRIRERINSYQMRGNSIFFFREITLTSTTTATHTLSETLSETRIRLSKMYTSPPIAAAVA